MRRREFLQTATFSATALAVPAGATAMARHGQGDLPVSPPGAVDSAQASPRVRSFIQSAREAILQELKPTEAQLERGLELHRNSIVCDLHGFVNLNHRCGMYSEKMKRWALQQLEEAGDQAADLIPKLRLEARKMRPIEVVRDPVFQADHRALYEAAGVTIGVECVIRPLRGGPGGQVERLENVARANYVYDNVDFLEKMTLPRLNNLAQLKSQGKHAVIWHCAGPDEYLAGPDVKDPIESLGLWAGLGLRASQLVNSTKNQIGCSHKQENDTGLTDLGRAFVRRMNQLGILVDLAHCGHKTTLDAIRASDAPVAATHTACRSVAVGGKSKYRNITDEALKALADKGGMVGIIEVPNLLGDYGIEAFFRHIDYAVKLVGADHVGFGSDFGGMGFACEPDEFIELQKPTSFRSSGLKGTKRYWEYLNEPNSLSWTNTPCFTVGLVCRGYSDEDIRKIIGGNFVRVLKAVCNKPLQGHLV